MHKIPNLPEIPENLELGAQIITYTHFCSFAAAKFTESRGNSKIFLALTSKQRWLGNSCNCWGFPLVSPPLNFSHSKLGIPFNSGQKGIWHLQTAPHLVLWDHRQYWRQMVLLSILHPVKNRPTPWKRPEYDDMITSWVMHRNVTTGLSLDISSFLERSPEMKSMYAQLNVRLHLKQKGPSRILGHTGLHN